MSEPTAPPERRSAPSGLANIFLPLLPVLACFLGGATTKWAEGVVLTLLGLYLLARPPRKHASTGKSGRKIFASPLGAERRSGGAVGSDITLVWDWLG
jgi:hypothetical protein